MWRVYNDFNKIEMELISDLDELEIGDWVKVYPNNKRYWKIGEITHKWYENKKPRFQLRIIVTSLPISTENVMKKLCNKKLGKDIYLNIDDFKRRNRDDEVYLLTKNEKNRIIKELIIGELK